MRSILNKIIMVFSILIVSALFFVTSKAFISSSEYKIDKEKNIISRIRPETTVENLKTKLENVKIYKEKELKTEVTDGLVGTGMYLKDEESVYELSVVGDLNGDGKATQVELTNIIRYIVGLKGANLDGIKYNSADITGDGTVDQRDITKLIRYIVYGELDLGNDVEEKLTVKLENLKQTSNQIKVQAISNNAENVEYTFYLKKANEDDAEYKKVQKGQDKILDVTKLKHNTEYTIKVIVKNIKGQEAQSIINVKTDRIPNGNEAGAIVFEETVWENNMASVKIKTDTNYQIQYQVNGTNGNWTNGDYVTGLKAGDIVYAKLSDGINSGTFIFKTIEPETVPVPDANESGAIIFGEVTWKNNKAILPISTNTKFYIEYQINNTSGNWIKANGTGASITVENLNHNDIVYARLTDGTQSGNYINTTIIDNIAPNLEISTTVISTSEIKAIVESSDDEWGMANQVKYTYSIKKEGEEYKVAYTGEDATYNFKNLSAGKTYTIKVEVQDKAENKTSRETTERTIDIPSGTSAGSIMFKNITWKNGKAKVDITTNKKEYYIEYQVNSTTGDWTKASEKGAQITIENLSHNDIVYARLTDGTSSGDYSSITIIDAIKPNVGIALTAENHTITATATANDDESGLENPVTYTFYMKETGESDSAYVQKQSGESNVLTVPNLVIGKNYTIKVEVKDKANNIGIQEKSILIPDDVSPIVDFTVLSKTSNTATVKATATDEGGLPNPTIYVFYIKETGADDLTYVEIQNSASDTCKFPNLVQGKDYTVKVTVADNAENIGVKERSILTDTIPSGKQPGAINFVNLTWTNGKANVDITTNTTYYIEYQINSTTGIWAKGQTAGAKVTVADLHSGDKLYARLTDGTSGSEWATLDILDTKAPTLGVSTNVATSKITATVTAVDNESGMPNPVSYTYSIKTGSEEYTVAYTGENASYNFTGLTQGTTYTIKVETRDNAGNKAIKETTITTKTIPTTAGSITIGQPVWGSGVANVTVTTNTSFYIEYQVNSTSGTWTRATTAGTAVTLNNLKHNDIVYARLTDGSSSGNYISLTIADTIAPEAFNITVSNITASGFKMSGNTTDKQTGLRDYTYVIEKGGTIVGKITTNKEGTTSNNIGCVSYNDNNPINTSRSDNRTIIRKWLI